jgi:hypothetical protein
MLCIRILNWSSSISFSWGMPVSNGIGHLDCYWFREIESQETILNWLVACSHVGCGTCQVVFASPSVKGCPCKWHCPVSSPVIYLSWLLFSPDRSCQIPLFPKLDTNIKPLKLKTKLHGLSPRANYTDRATAACRRSDCQLVRIEGATWSAWRIPPAVFLGFLDRSRYFSIK